ncbi:hypothetical protein BGZ81_009897, partial [Podila clonocystis]
MSFADIFGPNQSAQFESDIIQRQRSQELRQQQLRQLYQAHDGLLISSTQPSIADRVQEFRDSAQRARAAMRNSLNSELVIEEDAQVLLTGEVSRRRRRPFMGTETTATGATGTVRTTGTELVSGLNVEGAISEATGTMETSIPTQ